jgi:hypothetical protein
MYNMKVACGVCGNNVAACAGATSASGLSAVLFPTAATAAGSAARPSNAAGATFIVCQRRGIKHLTTASHSWLLAKQPLITSVRKAEKLAWRCFSGSNLMAIYIQANMALSPAVKTNAGDTWRQQQYP